MTRHKALKVACISTYPLDFNSLFNNLKEDFQF